VFTICTACFSMKIVGTVSTECNSFIRQWLYSPLLGPGIFFSFVICLTPIVGLLGRVTECTKQWLFRGAIGLLVERQTHTALCCDVGTNFLSIVRLIPACKGININMLPDIYRSRNYHDSKCDSFALSEAGVNFILHLKATLSLFVWKYWGLRTTSHWTASSTFPYICYYSPLQRTSLYSKVLCRLQCDAGTVGEINSRHGRGNPDSWNSHHPWGFIPRAQQLIGRLDSAW
jgi:hypothetical protein